MALSPGSLYLVPVTLGGSSPEQVIPAGTLAQIRRIRHFIAENARSARTFLKAVGHPEPMRALHISELNAHTPNDTLPTLLAPLAEGIDIGLMSEAGCPAVADPGSSIVAMAHERGLRVVPAVGPSSLLLALMASGMNGQRFAFHGYLPAREPGRSAAIRQIEKDSRRTGGVHLFIETPYRNQVLLDSILSACAPETRLCVATDLTLPSESVRTSSIAHWRATPRPDLDRRPCVFLIQS